jgi:dihydroorotase-like cyclic amidohydrolase
MSSNGAKRFGIYPRKGAIAPGADADLILVDLDATTTIHRGELLTQSRETDRLYDGRSFRGRVLRTLLAGRTVALDGEVTGAPGEGRFVRPEQGAS